MGGPDAMVAALRSKNVDAIVASAATGYLLQERGQGKVLFIFGSRIHDFLTHVIFANDMFIENRPDDLRRFLRGWFQTVVFMKQNRGEAIRISRKTTELSEKMAEKTYDEQMPMFYADGHFPRKNLQGTERALTEMGAWTQIPDDSELIDARFLPAP
jgi:NitT/TauT family transport system substrate-binding protein